MPVGTDKWRMPNGTRKVEKRKVEKWCWKEILREKPENPKSRKVSKSQALPRKVEKIQKNTKSRKVKKPRKVEKDNQNAKSRKVEKPKSRKVKKSKTQKLISREQNKGMYLVQALPDRKETLVGAAFPAGVGVFHLRFSHPSLSLRV